VSGIWLKRQKVAPVDAGEWGFPYDYSGNNYIMEYSGSLQYFFGFSPDIIPEYKPNMLRCYSGAGINYINPGWSQNCFYTNSDLFKEKNDLTCIFPNPSHDKLHIKSDECIELIEITDIKGNEIYKIIPQREQEVGINIRTFYKGVYIVKVFTGESIQYHKLLKQ